MIFRTRFFVLSGFAAMLASSAHAQLSAYYITDATSGLGSTHVWQGGVQQFSYGWVNQAEMPIVVGNFGAGNRVRQADGETFAPGTGDEYQLNGTPTGFTNTWQGADANTTAYDAAFNGTNIFMVDWSTGALYRYDNNYGSRTFMFNAHSTDIGITYDSANNTLWTSNYSSGLVQEWSMTGTAMFSFTDVNGSSAALAFDSRDGTLWMSDGSSGTNIYQYSTAGALLQTVQTNERVLGGEMVATPEPGVLAGLGLGALVLLRRRRSAR